MLNNWCNMWFHLFPHNFRNSGKVSNMFIFLTGTVTCVYFQIQLENADWNDQHRVQLICELCNVMKLSLIYLQHTTFPDLRSWICLDKLQNSVRSSPSVTGAGHVMCRQDQGCSILQPHSLGSARGVGRGGSKGGPQRCLVSPWHVDMDLDSHRHLSASWQCILLAIRCHDHLCGCHLRVRIRAFLHHSVQLQWWEPTAHCMLASQADCPCPARTYNRQVIYLVSQNH
jgi:hypothetical protein